MSEPPDPTDSSSATPRQTPVELFWTAVLFEGGLGVAAIILGWAFDLDVREHIPKFALAESAGQSWAESAGQSWAESVPTLIVLASSVGWGLAATVPMLLAIVAVQKLPLRSIRELDRLTQEDFFRSLLRLSYLELAAISLAAGVGEELLFRGWLLPTIGSMGDWVIDQFGLSEPSASMVFGDARIGLPMIAAVLLSSLAFGLVHPLSKAYVVVVFFIGLYLAFLLVWTDNLLIPIVAHAAYDAAQLAWAKYSDNPS